MKKAGMGTMPSYVAHPTVLCRGKTTARWLGNAALDTIFMAPMESILRIFSALSRRGMR